MWLPCGWSIVYLRKHGFESCSTFQTGGHLCPLFEIGKLSATPVGSLEVTWGIWKDWDREMFEVQTHRHGVRESKPPICNYLNVCKSPGMSWTYVSQSTVPSSLLDTSRSKHLLVLDWARYWNRSDAKFFQAWTLEALRDDKQWTIFQIERNLADSWAAFECLLSSLLRSASIRENQYLQSWQWRNSLLVEIVCFLMFFYKQLSPVSTISVYSKWSAKQ